MREKRIERPEGTYATCFGCGSENPDGLRLAFVETERGRVECRYAVPAHFRGPEGVIHGGIQATLLDETLGFAIESQLGVGDVELVTATFSLDYKRAAPIDTLITIRGSFDRTEGRSHFARGEIVDGAGQVCTTATARWVDVSARTTN